jgi:hypothetical protein
MGLFDSLINTNKSRWKAIANNNANSNDFKKIVENFFILDNIDIDKYIENETANSVVHIGLNMWELANSVSLDSNVQKQKINCTKSFREHFSNNRINRGLGIPDWFYIAYPDVAFWMHENSKNIKNEISGRENVFFQNDEILPPFFRFVIQKYIQQTGNHLECAK